MDEYKFMDKYLASLDPIRNENRVREILKTYAESQKKSIIGHLHLSEIFFETLDKFVRECENLDKSRIKAIKEVKDRFCSYAKVYIDSRTDSCSVKDLEDRLNSVERYLFSVGKSLSIPKNSIPKNPDPWLYEYHPDHSHPGTFYLRDKISHVPIPGHDYSLLH